jgi:hypothetical protein
MRALPAIGLLCLTAMAGAPGCGSDAANDSTHAAVRAPQKPAALPRSWTRKANSREGFSVGVPPHWEQSRRGDAVLFRSPDRLVALSLATDRRDAAFTTPPGRFARMALGSLRGYRRPLRPGPTRPVGGTPLQGAAVRSEGVARANGVRQKIEVAVLRRDHSVNFTALIAANARQTPHHELDVARRVVRTVRDRPPRAGAQRSGRSG